MENRIEFLAEKKLVGKHLSMSLANNRTGELWRSFMMQRKEIQNAVGNDLYSMQVHSPDYFQDFDPARSFEKWATTEVSSFDTIPDGMESFLLPAGMYAVFGHKGSPEEGAKVFQYIFGTWLPQSGYALDNRPHFEVLGENYKNGSPDSEEDIWIPVKLKP
jgi:AraC family transcriptional regulator